MNCKNCTFEGCADFENLGECDNEACDRYVNGLCECYLIIAGDKECMNYILNKE